MVRSALPVFESFTLWAADAAPTGCEPNAKLTWSTLAIGAGGIVAVPDRATAGLVSFVVRLNAAVFAPELVGLKVRLTVHDWPAGRLEAQVVV
jgi:hypothetical protein